MAYFISILVFIVGFALFIIAHVIAEEEIGSWFSICSFPIVLLATVWTFIKIRKKKKKPTKIVALTSTAISRYAQKDFSKVFSNSYLEQSSIKSVYITASKLQDFDFSILVESDNYNSIDQKILSKRIKKRFYEAHRIKILEYKNQDVTNLFKISQQ